MIAKIWRGNVRPKHGDEYVAYVEETSIRNYREISGNPGAHLLRRDMNGCTGIVTLTFQESMEEIKAFAGGTPERARYYPDEDRYLIDRRELTEHYEVPLSVIPNYLIS